MKVSDIFLLSSQGLRERKFRFALNLIGVLIGCMAVTGLISLTQGLNDLIGEQLEVFGPNTVMIMPGSLEMGAGFIASQSFNWRDIQTIERVANIEIVTPVVGGKMCSLTQRGQTRYAFVYGIEAAYFEIVKGWDVEEGRYIRRGDTAMVLLGHDIARPKDRDTPGYEVGDRIALVVLVGGEEKEMSFRVVGIMEKSGGIGGMSSDEDQSVFIPLRTCQQLFEVGGDFQYVVCRVSDPDDLPKAVMDLEERLGDDVTIMTAESMQEMIGTILGAVEAVLGGVAAISLVVAGVGIVNTMTISVMERTREIGILKAIGSRSSDILLMFLSEAMVTGIVGGVLGASMGFALGNIIGQAIDMPVSSSMYLGLGVVVFAMVTTSLSGLYPAWRASRLHPVEALRSE
jgi:putative ABC transport system permease protein